VFVNTDLVKKPDTPWTRLGVFDKSLERLGFNPKHQPDNNSRTAQYRVVQENKFYFETMCRSKFVLCPAGDAPWAFRWYEILMCKSLPIVLSWHHTYRTAEEATIPFQHVLVNIISTHLPAINANYDELVAYNTRLFKNIIHLKSWTD